MPASPPQPVETSSSNPTRRERERDEERRRNNAQGGGGGGGGLCKRWGKIRSGLGDLKKRSESAWVWGRNGRVGVELGLCAIFFLVVFSLAMGGG